MSVNNTLAIIVVMFLGGISSAAALPEVDIHDPALIKDGKRLYLYSTGPGITFYSSNDRVHWSGQGRVFAGEPVWARSVSASFNGHVWAPDVSYAGGKYYLYYTVSGFGKNDSAIGVAVNKTLDPASPDYRWEDKGIVLRSVAGRDDWNAIDANVIDDASGTPWMAFGSFWSGIKLVKLNPDRIHVAEPQEWHSIAARPRGGADARAPGDGAVEGPFLYRKGDFYYLFVSTGYCCRGKASTYRVAVGRSKTITGPYLDKDGVDMVKGGGTPLLSENPKWAGWGGQGVYNLDGKDVVVMHAYEAADNNFHRLKILPISWDATGWPAVDGAALDRFHTTLKN
ncbi:arabinan endo-1,5-alpha-L-arabinosidase [Rhizomicrobium palustre]|uniref:Extracellular exo-alpha-(1->5)-L-arabinofuranosidase n=1 Tax=Rhizomicrobium palustre TaxID=189966 RepID=A0A846MVN2_9PROT|nr:family 43 glycosylhydrolase [Rhizomicrobium palustre]NIK87120.1 arabinan endo-1,5-alpha-L-arabinosidase [Rhizomicrobium palustre]